MSIATCIKYANGSTPAGQGRGRGDVTAADPCAVHTEVLTECIARAGTTFEIKSMGIVLHSKNSSDLLH